MLNKGTILKNFLSLSASQILSKVFGFFTIIYIARVLGTENFGKLSFATAIASYFLVFSNLGLDTYAVMEVARRKGLELQERIDCIFTLRLILTLISFLMLLILIAFIPKSLEIKTLIFVSGLTLFSVAITLDWFFIGIERMSIIAISGIVKSVLYFGFIFLLIKLSHQTIQVAIIDICTKVISALVVVIAYFSMGNAIRLKINRDLYKDIMKQSIPIGLSLMVGMIYYNFDSILLGLMKGERFVGWYNAAYRIIDTILILPAIIVRVYFPALSKSMSDNIQTDDSIKEFIKSMFYIGLPIGVGGLIIASPLIKMMFGDDYHSSVIPLQILCLNVAVIFMNTSFNRTLLAFDKQAYVLKAICCGAVTNIIGNFLLIPQFDIIGAAVATLIAEVAVLIYAFVTLRRYVVIRIQELIYVPAMSSLVMFVSMITTLYFTENIFVLFVIGLLVYSGVIYRMNGFKYIVGQ